VAPSIASRASTRISEDQRAVLLELSKMSDRLVQSREELATMTARATRAEADLTAANARMMAAQVLVQDAQRATHASAERAAWLEGRCETLQEALDLAVNASMLTRWRWRRQQRA
jgi:predicted  nucleic acid-binding Zn-ribbon protein